MKATRFSLFELLLLTTCVAICCALTARAGAAIACCFFVTVLTFRTAIVDFTPLGGFATLATVVFGSLTLVLTVLQAMTW